MSEVMQNYHANASNAPKSDSSLVVLHDVEAFEVYVWDFCMNSRESVSENQLI